MSESSHPHDPFASEPGTTPQAPQEASAAAAQQHPHDPYAYDAGARDPLDIDPAPADEARSSAAPSPEAPQQAFSPAPQQSPYAAPQQPAPAAAQGQPAPAYGAAPTHDGQSVPPSGTPGLYDGPLSGQPVSRTDSTLWATFAQGSVALGHLVSVGFLGWVGPLIIFLMYKDRDRFVRFHAAEALNGAIAVVIAQLVLGVVVTIMAVVTLGIGSILYPVVGIPALLQLIFSIIGAVKANQGEYWSYPFNLRLVK